MFDSARVNMRLSALAPKTAHEGRAAVALVVACAAFSIGVAMINSEPILVWNASASAPIGLYALVSHDARRGDLALVRTPPSVRELAAARGYLPANVPMVKRIAAANSDIVCASKELIFINGKAVAARRDHDSAHRPLPSWSGCRRLARDEVFLLMAPARDSFDGRYFGPTPRASIIGRLEPLWTE
jgi:conjugative transfer signal peptidase TraF